jgi:hypothetical protein
MQEEAATAGEVREKRTPVVGTFPETEDAAPQRGEVWLHFKGKRCAITGFSHHTTNNERLVEYYENGMKWSRPLSEFFDIVEYEGRQIPRFVKER